MIRNVHERTISAPVDDVGRLIDGLSGPGDVLWPSPPWPPLRFDRPLGLDATGGHGPMRYRVTAYVPGRRVVCTFEPGRRLDGTHTLVAEAAGPDRTVVRHVLSARLRGVGLVGWPLLFRSLHDALVEDLLDRAESTLGVGPARRHRCSPWVRLVRRVLVRRAPVRRGQVRVQTVPVPDTPLLAAALPRVDWSDAHAVAAPPGTSHDPQAWADAVFRDPPSWVVAAVGLREALGGMVGIERGGPSSFDTITRSADEVLLGTDQRHLNFRVSVWREPDRVVLSTVVRLNNTRCRAYYALVRHVHPVIVRARLARAARRLSRRSAEGEHSDAFTYDVP